MTTLTMDRLPTARRHGLWAELFRREPLFAAGAAFFLMLMLPTGLAALLDDRAVQGVSVWVKPLKFEFSIALFLASLAWFAHHLPDGTRGRRWYRVYSAMVVVGLLGELAWIGFAASRGVASHFNRASPAWATAYAIAGVTAVMFTMVAPVFAWQIRRNARADLTPAMRAAIVDGLLLTGVLTILAAGYLGSSSGHFVGSMPSDAGGAAIMGWARNGGDLRVAHFFATHALQAIPLFALAAARLFGERRVLPVRLFALGYTALTLFTLVQAAMGLPFLPGLL
jgi:hypothetical protein